MLEPHDFDLWLQEGHHIPECEQSDSEECICLEILENKRDSEDDTRIQEYFERDL